MTGFTPRRAMVLAAGRGERLRPITDTIPKPLLRAGGRTLIDRALDSLADAGVERAVVNLWHLADKLAAHLAGRARPEVALSREAELLDTGGGIAAALARFAGEAFCAANSDVVVLDGVEPAWRRLARAWDDAAMDALLLLHPAAGAFGYSGLGDFAFEPSGAPRRRREREIAPFVYTGRAILSPRLFAGAPAGAFSLNPLFDRALAAGRLAAIVHDGAWLHVGTPEALRGVDAALARLQ